MPITNGYATLAEVKAALRIPVADTVDDDLLEIAIESASRQIDGFCERVFYDVGSETRYYSADSASLCFIDDLQSISSLTTSSDGETWDTTWTATDYSLEPLNGLAGGLASPYTRIRAIGDYLFPTYANPDIHTSDPSVRVVGTWGYAEIPSAVRQATILYSMRQFKRYDSPLGIAGFGDIGAMRVGRIDPDVEAMLSPFRRLGMG